MKTFLSKYSLAAWVLLIPCVGWAWGDFGHQTVATIAERNMSASTKKQIKKILGKEKLIDAAIWPDVVKKDDAWKFTSPYHYADRDTDKDYWSSKPAPEGDALRALIKYAEILADKKASQKDQLIALRMLVHLMGDMYMPLHLGEKSDQGGNKISVDFSKDFKFVEPVDPTAPNYPKKEPNLHSVWDHTIPKYDFMTFCGKQTKLDQAKYAKCLSQRFMRETFPSKVDPEEWMAESIRVINNVVERFPPSTKGKEHILGEAYMNVSANVVGRKIYLSGFHLAKLLNYLFTKHELPQEFKQFQEKAGKTFGATTFDFFKVSADK